MLSRRNFQLLVAGGVLGLAGCTENGSNPSSDKTGAPSSTEVQLESRTDQVSCDEVDGSHVITIKPNGAHLVVESRDAAETIGQRVKENTASSETAIVERGDGDGFALELYSDNPVVTSEDISGFEDEVTVKRDGLSVPTLRKIAESLRANLQESDIDYEGVDFSIHEPEPPNALTLMATVYGARDQEIVSKPQSIKFFAVIYDRPPSFYDDAEVQTKKQFATGSHFSVTGVRQSDDGPIGEIQFSDAGTERVVSRLESVNALSNIRTTRIHVTIEEELVFDGRITQEFASNAKDGNWDGKLALSMSEENANRFEDYGNLIESPAPTVTRVTPCD